MRILHNTFHPGSPVFPLDIQKLIYVMNFLEIKSDEAFVKRKMYFCPESLNRIAGIGKVDPPKILDLTR